MEVVLAVLAYVVGAAIVGATLLSAMRTVVLPRGEPVRLSTFVFLVTRRLFDLWSRRTRSWEAQDRVMAQFAPLTLLLMPLVWMTLVLLGFTLMFWASGVHPLLEAFYTSGSSLFTLGFERPEGFWPLVLSFTEAALAIAVLALLLVTYLPSMYAAFSRREQAVSTLEVRAGSPPTGVEMLVRYATIQGLDQLDTVWEDWERLFADLAETHTSLSALVFFRSPQPDHSWLTAAGAVLDGAALLVSCVEGADDGWEREGQRILKPAAEICIRGGFLALGRIADFFDLPYAVDPRPDDPISITREEFDEAFTRMAEAGVPLVDDRDGAWERFAGWRVNYDQALLAIAGLIMAPYAPWSSDRGSVYSPRIVRRARTAR